MWRIEDRVRYGLRAANIEEVIRKIKTSLARLYTQFLTSTYPSLLIKMSSFLLLSKELFTWKFYDLFQGRMMWVFESDLPVFFFFSKFLQLNMTRYYVLDPINILIFSFVYISFIGPWKDFSLSMYDFELAKYEKSYL